MKDACVKFIIESRVDNLALIGKGIMGMCSHVIDDLNKLYLIQLGIIEVLNNIIEHAYKGESNHSIEILMCITDKIISFEISDSGIVKPPSNQQNNEPHFDAKDPQTIPEAGMGLHIISKVMDEVKYTRSGEKNITFLKKNL